jgi:hypothetical protein
MGNRGVLHDDRQQIVRDSQVRRWIACVLEFRGRKRAIMQPRRYTELFFLDEPTAMAAGHRPCAECRRADYLRFLDAWRTAHGPLAGSVDVIDRQLHAERRLGPWHKRTYDASVEALPNGAMFARDGAPWLVRGDRVARWSADGYVDHQARPRRQTVTVLTPASLVGVLHAGYQPAAHPSAD